MKELTQKLREFAADRDWEQFHNPKNLSAAIAIEAAELLEHFQWLTGEESLAAVRDEGKRAAIAGELADVLIYALSLANALEVDVSAAVLDKLERNEKRFPAERYTGRAPGIEP